MQIEKITKGKSTFDAIKKCKIESLDEFKNINRLASSNAKLLFDKYSNILLNESSHIVTSITLKRIKRIDSKELETSTVINFVRLCDVDRLLKGIFLLVYIYIHIYKCIYFNEFIPQITGRN